MIDQPLGQELEPQSKLLAPSPVLVEILNEAHTPCSEGIGQYSIAPAAANSGKFTKWDLARAQGF
jgi:hypothetical protein